MLTGGSHEKGGEELLVNYALIELLSGLGALHISIEAF